MKRFINNPRNAQRKFTKSALRMHKLNYVTTNMRGGFRL